MTSQSAPSAIDKLEKDPSVFLSDVKDHQMQVLLDQGVHRHLRFSQPTDSFLAAFDIITWPGHLTISGDYGTFTFARTEDMFTFFDSLKKYGTISPRYWAEKLCRPQPEHEKFSQSAFRKQVMFWYKGQCEMCDYDEDDFDEVEGERPRDLLLREINRQIFRHLHDETDEARCRDLLENFSWRDEAGRTHEFNDVWEYEFNDYTVQYLWCCWAVTWAVQQYRDAKTATETPANA